MTRPDLLGMSVGSLMAAYGPDSSFSKFIRRIGVENYDEFVAVLYEDLDDVFRSLQNSADVIKHDDENRLTTDIKSQLNRLGYSATHDEKIRGHTDIVVKKGSYLWLGEAKIWGGASVIRDGFDQLCRRYSNGDKYADRGGLLIYLDHPDAKKMMERWANELEGMGLREFERETCALRDLCFHSSHRHEVSGRPYRVRHMPLLRHHAPTV